MIVIVCRARNTKAAAAFADELAPKKGVRFSLIYFFRSFVYYIPHDYVIPQLFHMPQTHSAFYPHRFFVTPGQYQWSSFELKITAEYKH